jgi:hypothetical protein
VLAAVGDAVRCPELRVRVNRSVAGWSGYPVLTVRYGYRASAAIARSGV